MTKRRLGLLAPLLAMALLAAACSATTSSTAPSAASSTASSSAPTAAASASSGSGAMCDDVAALRASIAALKDLKLLEVGTAGVKTAVADVKARAEAVKVSAGATLGQPIDDLLTAVAALQTTVTSLGDQSGLAAAAVSIKASIEQIGTAAAGVQTTMSSPCPSM